jgi:GNAT superfamily N-acetyltransferase
VIPVREIAEEELGELARVLATVDPDSGATVATLVDWRRQAEQMAWLLAEDGGSTAGGAVVLVGWHNPREVAMARIGVLPEHRRGGVGTALYRAASAWAGGRDASELESQVRADDPDSLAWAERRGFRETSRNSMMVLDLADVEPPPADPPPGIEIVPWAGRPDLAAGMYEVAREAVADIPGNEDDEIGDFQTWLRRDMQGVGDRPEATFVALEGSRVVGFAKFSIGGDENERAFHDLTGVLRAWRGRGIAAALKRTQIAWAKEQGFARLATFNEERNEPIRRLNARHGYRLEPGSIVLRGPLSA